MAEVVLGNGVGGKACAGWLLWEGITTIATSLQTRREEPRTTGDASEPNRLEMFGLLSTPAESTSTGSRFVDDTSRRSSAPSEALFWRVLQLCYLMYLALRFVVREFVTSLTSSRAARSPARNQPATTTTAPTLPTATRPILGSTIFSLTAALLDLGDRMPWLCGCLSLGQQLLMRRPLSLGARDGTIDRYVEPNFLIFPPPLLWVKLGPLLSLRWRCGWFGLELDPVAYCSAAA